MQNSAAKNPEPCAQAESEAYIGEIDAIGSAYEELQAQNARLVQQMAERDEVGCPSDHLSCSLVPRSGLACLTQQHAKHSLCWEPTSPQSYACLASAARHTWVRWRKLSIGHSQEAHAHSGLP